MSSAPLLALEDLAHLSLPELNHLVYDWSLWARPEQLPPDHPSKEDPIPDWETWLAIAGRGWGKTRVGAEQVLRWVDQGYRRIHIVAPTTSDTRDVIVEGDSGILNIAHPKKRPRYEPSKRRLTFPNGAIALLFSAEEPERLRGPQCEALWCFSSDTLILTDHGPIPLLEIDPATHKALLPWGTRRFLSPAILTHSEKKVCTLSVQSDKITVTEDHPFFDPSTGSFAPLDRIKCVQLVKNISTRPTISVLETISTGVEVALSRGQSILLRWGLYHRVIKSTIRTLIGWMTGLRIWSVSRKLSTSSATLHVGQSNPKSDTHELHSSLDPAFSVVSSSKSKTGPLTTPNQSSAPEPALRSGGLTLSSLRLAFVRFVKTHIRPSNPSRSTAARNAILEPAESEGPQLTRSRQFVVERLAKPQAVYDLAVEGGVFIANNFLVHNCDELAAWQYLQETWDQAMFGLRLGKHPQIVVTTTPKPLPLIRQLLEQSKKNPRTTVLSSGSTYDNRANLAKTFFSKVAQYEGTRLGNQELHAQLIDPRETGIIRHSWLKLFPHSIDLPIFEYILQSYDTAFTEATLDRKSKDPDPTAATTWGAFKLTQSVKKSLNLKDNCPYTYGVLLLDAWSDLLGYPELRSKVKNEYNHSSYNDRKADAVLIENKGSGISLRQELQRVVPVRAYNPGHADKVERLHSVSHLPCRGLVFIPESRANPGQFVTWADDFIEQLTTFPLVVHDDYVDTFSQALAYLRDLGYLRIDEDIETEDVEEYVKPRENPYS